MQKPSPIAPTLSKTVLICDPHLLYAQALGTALGQHHDISVIAQHPTSALEACQAAEQYRADIVLLEYWMPDLEGANATRTILSSNPECKVVLVSGFFSQQDIERAYEAGAAAFLPKSCGVEDLARTVRELDAGNSRDSQTFEQEVEVLAGKLDESTDTTRKLWAALRRLTPREIEILSLLNIGMQKDDIARHLVISSTTVQTHIRNILRKMGNRPQSEVLYHARRFGLLST